MDISWLKQFRLKHKNNIIFAMLGVLIIVVLIVIYMVYTATHYNTDFYQISSNNINSNIRIVYVSDLHNHEYGKDNIRLINDIKNLNPDLIISGGDLVVERDDDYEVALRFCSELSEIAPFYGVFGNHEETRIYLRGDTELRGKFEKTGLKILTDKAETVEINGNKIELVGISGGAEQFEKYGAKKFMDKLPPKTADVRICICHVPITFPTKLTEYSFDLGLSGHTHGGLMVIPRIGAVYSSEEKFLPEYYAGIYQLDNAPFIISRGLGDSKPIPRINNPHELSVIDLKRY